MWKKICAALMLLLLTGCQTSNEVKLGNYASKNEDIAHQATLTLSDEDGENHFTFSTGAISSTIYSGTFESKDNQLILHDEKLDATFYLDIKKESLIVNHEKSNNLLDEDITLHFQ